MVEKGKQYLFYLLTSCSCAKNISPRDVPNKAWAMQQLWVKALGKQSLVNKSEIRCICHKKFDNGAAIFFNTVTDHRAWQTDEAYAKGSVLCIWFWCGLYHFEGWEPFLCICGPKLHLICHQFTLAVDLAPSLRAVLCPEMTFHCIHVERWHCLL